MSIHLRLNSLISVLQKEIIKTENVGMSSVKKRNCFRRKSVASFVNFSEWLSGTSAENKRLKRWTHKLNFLG